MCRRLLLGGTICCCWQIWLPAVSVRDVCSKTAGGLSTHSGADKVLRLWYHSFRFVEIICDVICDVIGVTWGWVERKYGVSGMADMDESRFRKAGEGQSLPDCLNVLRSLESPEMALRSLTQAPDTMLSLPLNADTPNLSFVRSGVSLPTCFLLSMPSSSPEQRVGACNDAITPFPCVFICLRRDEGWV